MLSPAQVAQLAGVSRRTVMRAIDGHDLRAIRDNKNRWKVSPEDASSWASAQCAPSEQPPTEPTPSPTDLSAIQAENIQLRERLTAATARADAAEAERDRWQAMADKLADPRHRKRWWLWGRN